MPKIRPAFSLIEVVLSVALFALLVSGMAGAIVYLQQNALLATQQDQALMLAEEGLEAARGLAAGGFSSLPAGTFGLSAQGGTWTLSGSSDQTGIFSRSLIVTDVAPGLKEVTSNVDWTQNLQRTGSVSLTTRLGNWRGN